MARVKALYHTAWFGFAPVFIGFVWLHAAAAADVSMQHHAWGRFKPGAWCVTRTVTEAIDENGQPVGTTTTETYTELVAVDARRGTVELSEQSSLEVGGKEFIAPAQTVSQGLHGETLGRELEAKDLGSQVTVVAGETIPCKVRSYRVVDKDQEKEVEVFYASGGEPQIVRRVTVAKVGPNKETRYTSDFKVVSLETPRSILDRSLMAADVKVVLKNGKTSTVTNAVYSKDVPGEATSYEAEEFDGDGRLIRRSKMELVDYGYRAPDQTDSFRNRRQYRRWVRRGRK
jgi:hypothetical protein